MAKLLIVICIHTNVDNMTLRLFTTFRKQSNFALSFNQGKSYTTKFSLINRILERIDTSNDIMTLYLQ